MLFEYSCLNYIYYNAKMLHGINNHIHSKLSDSMIALAQNLTSPNYHKQQCTLTTQIQLVSIWTQLHCLQRILQSLDHNERNKKYPEDYHIHVHVHNCTYTCMCMPDLHVHVLFWTPTQHSNTFSSWVPFRGASTSPCTKLRGSISSGASFRRAHAGYH